MPYRVVLPKENIDYPGSSSLKIDEKTGKSPYFKPTSEKSNWKEEKPELPLVRPPKHKIFYEEPIQTIKIIIK